MTFLISSAVKSTTIFGFALLFIIPIAITIMIVVAMRKKKK